MLLINAAASGCLITISDPSSTNCLIVLIGFDEETEAALTTLVDDNVTDEGQVGTLADLN